jgi:hypothetical protein
MVAGLRKKHQDRSTPWTIEELERHEVPELTNRNGWKLTASHNAGSLKQSIDGDRKSRYTTNKGMQAGMWVQVEFPTKSRVSGLVLDCRGSNGDYPRGYKVEVSNDGTQWSRPVAKGKGKNALLEIKFAPVEAKFLRVTQTGKNGLYWSIHELKVLGKGL